MFNYPEVYNRLNVELGIIIFMKKNGEVRVMLGTRNLNIASYAFAIEGQTVKNSLAGHDNRCNIKNGNIAVMDVMIGEARSFNIERLVYITYLGNTLLQITNDHLLHEIDLECCKNVQRECVRYMKSCQPLIRYSTTSSEKFDPKVEYIALNCLKCCNSFITLNINPYYI